MRLRVPARHLPYVPVVIFTSLSLGLLSVRMISLDNQRFLFMAWNLFLAWLPLLWAELLRKGLKTRRWLSPANTAYSLLWLAFLPNSFYMVTDFIHVRLSDPKTVLFDAVMFMSFATAGILLGCMSTYLIHRQLARRLAWDMTWLFLTCFFFLASLAIYMGRYLSWNSWDLLVNPFYILLDLSNRLTTPEGLSTTLATTILFFLFITACYVSYYTIIKALRAAK